MENKFLTVIKENEIELSEGQNLASKFVGFMNKMATIEADAKAILVTDISQKDEMKKARELRLTLKDMRVESENVRKSLKEDSLKRGKLIDGLAKIVKDTIVPIEEYLELQEKFAENLEKQRIESQNAERLAKISAFADPELYNYKEMSEEVFNALVKQLEDAHIAKLEAQKKAEEARIEAERLAKEEAEKNRIELEKLKKENEERAEQERLAKIESDRIEAERLAKEKAEREEAQRKIDEANAEAERARKELADKEEAERKSKQEAAEAERQAKLAPEKDKLFAWAEKIKSIESPEGLSVAGLVIVKQAEEKLLTISQEIKESLKNL